MKDLSKTLNRFVLQKFIFFGLHLGSLKSLWNPQSKPFLQAFRNGFCILNPSLTFLYLRRVLKVLVRTHMSKKKILFVGGPVGLEREFSLLCKRNGHYFLGEVTDGFFSNYKNDASSSFSGSSVRIERPALIFLFDSSLNSVLFEEIKTLDIPFVSFVSTEDDYSLIDYPIPANIKSKKGALFVYNLFHHIFMMKQLKFVKKKRKLKK